MIDCSSIAHLVAAKTGGGKYFVDIAANICRNCRRCKYLWTIGIATFHFGNRIQIKQSNPSNIPGKIRPPGIVEHFVIIWYYEHRRLIARQNRSLMIIAARNRALMTTCAVNCRSQVRQMSVYRVLSGDYGGGIGGIKVL